VGQMTNILFVLAGVAVLLVVGALIGSGLHTRAIDQRYRQVGQLVRELNEREAMTKRGYTRGVYEEPGLTLPQFNGNGAGHPVNVPSPRRYDAPPDCGPAPHASAAVPGSGEAGTVGTR